MKLESASPHSLPLHPLPSHQGIASNLSDTLIAIHIPQSAHHLDLRGSNAADPQEVVLARQQIKAILLSWVDLAREERMKRANVGNGVGRV